VLTKKIKHKNRERGGLESLSIPNAGENKPGTITRAQKIWKDFIGRQKGVRASPSKLPAMYVNWECY
jgi:hypothetical protein